MKKYELINNNNNMLLTMEISLLVLNITQNNQYSWIWFSSKCLYCKYKDSDIKALKSIVYKVKNGLSTFIIKNIDIHVCIYIYILYIWYTCVCEL